MRNDDLNGIREGLKKLFEFEGIKQIVCVDDQYREFKDDMIEEIIAQLEAHDINKLCQLSDKIRELKSIVWEDEDTWKNQIRRIWDSSIDTERKNLFNRINEVISISSDFLEKDFLYSISLRKIIDPTSSGVELIELSYSQWKDSYGPYGEKLNNDDIKERSLFLFDQDLSKENGGLKDGGIKIIQKLLNNNENIAIMCGLFSQTFNSANEVDRWEEFASKYDIDKNRFVLISKQNLTEDQPGFVRRLRLPILSKYCNDLKKQASDILDKSFKESNKKINELSVYDFEKIVFDTSYEEGIWETDTLFRLYNIYHQHSIYQKVIETQDIFDTTDNIREISKIEIGKIDENFSELWKIQRLEYYEDGDQINRLHRPIELGDIFSNTNGKKFILLAQPCNLMVRTSKPKGERANDFHEAILARITEKKLENNDLYSELLYFDEKTGESRYVDFRKTHGVLLCILDLCVFNTDGDARISSDDICPPSVLPAWNYRFNILKKKFETIIAEYSKYSDKKYEENFLKKYLLPKSPAYGKILFKPKLQIDPKNGQATIKYDCKRIGRLCKQRAEAILLKYSHYISRSAFEHDFGK